jgi:hypothetical protein
MPPPARGKTALRTDGEPGPIRNPSQTWFRSNPTPIHHTGSSRSVQRSLSPGERQFACSVPNNRASRYFSPSLSCRYANSRSGSPTPPGGRDFPRQRRQPGRESSTPVDGARDDACLRLLRCDGLSRLARRCPAGGQSVRVRFHCRKHGMISAANHSVHSRSCSTLEVRGGGT